jgi:hypothetical protein
MSRNRPGSRRGWDGSLGANCSVYPTRVRSGPWFPAPRPRSVTLLGGATLYAALGASLWGLAAGVASVRGYDYPATALGSSPSTCRGSQAVVYDLV